jgi:hypothetical protein
LYKSEVIPTEKQAIQLLPILNHLSSNSSDVMYSVEFKSVELDADPEYGALHAECKLTCTFTHAMYRCADF